MKTLVIFIFSFIFLFVLGCGAIEQNRIRQEVLEDYSIPAEIRHLIWWKKIRVGMTKRQVQASWGSPVWWSPCTSELVVGGVKMESWSYEVGRSCGGTILYFRNGRLIGWRD